MISRTVIPLSGKDRSRARAVLRGILIEAQHAKCLRCGQHMRLGRGSQRHKRRATLDHVTPKSKGGENVFGNFVLLCLECNSRKADTHDAELVKLCRDLWERIDQ